VTPIYEQARSGSHIALASAWIAAVGFTLQIYFDFSGYTDMALGIARLFGIRLPPNFNSPLRASSIIDFWLRWHMTLTRFLTAYIYNPLTLWLTRRRAARGLSGFSLRNMSPRTFIEFLMFPILLTMFVSGIWHGAGYTFIAWGLLHGLFLVVNHAWRQVGPKMWRDKSSYARFMLPAGFIITFTCVTASMVIFRSANLKTAADLLQGLIGLHGLGFKSGIALRKSALWIGGGAFIALACPNTLQILSRYEPALGWKPSRDQGATAKPRILWSPSLAWAVAMAVIVAIGILNLGGQSEFLYWQF
jgi:D-alanyl-lipoteichoic acid acyltransferase DltB (MBOAT superfamily)